MKNILKKQENRFIKSLALLCLAAVVCSSFVGCNLFDEIDKAMTYTPSSSRAESSKKEITPLPPSDGRTLYGYDSLKSDKGKEIYAKISKFANREDDSQKEFYIDGVVSEIVISEAMNAFQIDYPEIFWINPVYRYYNLDEYTYIELDYITDENKIDELKSKLDNAVDKILNDMPNNLNELETELYIHDYLVDNCKYDHSAYDAIDDDDYEGNAYNAYGAIVEGNAVCEGYSEAFNLLCKKSGINCTTISGISENEGHEWNAVMIGGEWYQVDVTWDDPESGNDESDKVSRYLYFNLDNEAMYTDHKIDKLFSEISYEEYKKVKGSANVFVPDCTATEYNYFNYYAAKLNDVDEADEVIYDIADAAKNGDDFLYIQIDESLDFEDTYNRIMDDYYLYDWIDSANKVNSYEPEINGETYVYKFDEFRALAVIIEEI